MRCNVTSWRNFRNLASRRLRWEPGLTLLVGENGAGKSNVLEAFSLLAGWGPLPGRLTRDVPTWGQSERALLGGVFEGEEHVETGAACGRCAILARNGSRVAASEMRSFVPSLLFSPQDLALVEGGPSTRRRFLDRVAALFFPLYARRLHDYRRGIAARAALLRRGKDPSVTMHLLVPLAAWLWEARETVVAEMCTQLHRWRDVAPDGTEIAFMRGRSAGVSDVREDYESAVVAYMAAEKAAGTPLVGPQRDDLLLTAEGRSAEVALSRGKRRRLAVALVLAAGGAVERKLRRAPILLLDEVAAELDAAGRERLFSALLSSGWQVIAATAEEPGGWPGSIRCVERGFVAD